MSSFNFHCHVDGLAVLYTGPLCCKPALRDQNNTEAAKALAVWMRRCIPLNTVIILMAELESMVEEHQACTKTLRATRRRKREEERAADRVAAATSLQD